MTMKKAFCLVSGGIERTTCLHKACMDYRPQNTTADEAHAMLRGEHVTPDIDWVEAFSIDYGQRHKKEGDYAKKTCESLDIKHHWLQAAKFAGQVMLTDDQIEIPNISY